MTHNISLGAYVVGTRAGLSVEGTVVAIRPDVDDTFLIKAYFAGGSYRDEKGEYALLSLSPDQITTIYGGSNATQE